MQRDVLSLILGGGRGTRLYPADHAAQQAGRAHRRQVPPHRHPHQQLHQQRLQPHLRADAVPQRQPAPPHRQHLQVRPVQPRLRRGPGRPADQRGVRLVPGHRRRRPPEHPLRPRGPVPRRADPVRRPALPHGLPPAAQDAPRHQGRRDHRRAAGAARADAGLRHRRSSTTPAASPASSRSRKTAEQLDAVPHAGRVDRAARHRRPAAGPTWPAWASTCSSATPCSTCSTRRRWPPTSARRSSRAASTRTSVQAHLFDGYWEDLGTIKSYHEANLALASDDPPFDFHSPEGVIYTRMRYLPASRIDAATLDHCLISDGCVIGAGTHDHALRHRRPHPDRPRTCTLREHRHHRRRPLRDRRASRPRTSAAACPTSASATARVIENAILDKDCRIGANVRIVNQRQGQGRRRRELRHPRRHRGHPQGGGRAGWDGDLSSSPDLLE